MIRVAMAVSTWISWISLFDHLLFCWRLLILMLDIRVNKLLWIVSFGAIRVGELWQCLFFLLSVVVAKFIESDLVSFRFVRDNFLLCLESAEIRRCRRVAANAVSVLTESRSETIVEAISKGIWIRCAKTFRFLSILFLG